MGISGLGIVEGPAKVALSLEDKVYLYSTEQMCRRDLRNYTICTCRLVITDMITDAGLLGLHTGKSATTLNYSALSGITRYECGEKLSD